MISAGWIALVTALTPLGVGAAMSRLAHASPEAARRLTFLSAALALAGAVVTCVALATSGTAAQSTAIFVLDPGGLAARASIYVDTLTCVMLVMVTVVGTAVSRFSVRYLDGDPDQARFSQWLSFSLGAVCCLIVAGNLVLLWLAWVATSLGLHKLLTYYKDRPAGQLAARKKFLISRLGDVLLLFSLLLVYLLFDTVDYVQIFTAAGDIEAHQPWVTLAAVFLVLGAMTKSAQLPFHTWLPDTMETPTPVSAFMHAGIINAGGFLLIRLSPVLVEAPLALDLLAAVGATTAVVGSIVMLTQTDIKRKLAYSTVSQMGFMMLQIGLGAFALAVLHIVGHSFYKAHAFASASSVVRTHGAYSAARPDGFGPVVASLGFAGLLVGGVSLGLFGLTGVNLLEEPGAVVLGGVLWLAIAQMMLAGTSVAAGSLRAGLTAMAATAFVAAAYVALGLGSQELLASVLATPGTLVSRAAPYVLGLFGLGFVMQVSLRRLERSPAGRRLYVHAHNGFYLGVLQDRFVERMWPSRPAR